MKFVRDCSFKTVLLVITSFVSILHAGQHIYAQAQLGTTVTFYQETNLKIGNQSLNGRFDLRLTVFDRATAGNQIGARRTLNNVSLDHGQIPLLSVNFGDDVFIGDARWIEFEARPTGNGGYTTITPRVRVRPVPVALALPGLRTEQTGGAPNVIGGSTQNNSVNDGMQGAAIGGGNSNRIFSNFATIGGGSQNSTSGEGAFVGGGSQNSAGSLEAAVVGGLNNGASGQHSFVGGGEGNRANALRSVVTGGLFNVASGERSFVGSGNNNQPSGGSAVIVGGLSNTASGSLSFIGCGDTNLASGPNSVLGGGFHNMSSGNATTVGGGSTNTASGTGATVPGGVGNVASGSYSFAAGRRAVAGFDGSIVFADSTNADFFASGANLFTARASGGVAFYTSANLSTGLVAFAGSNSWSAVSDRNVKENFEIVDPRDILDKVCALPVTRWNLLTQDPSIRHMGPMAQDFKAAFGLGEDDRHISSSDADGVALAAIQGLNAKVESYRSLVVTVQNENAELRNENAQLRDRLAALEAAVVSLTNQLSDEKETR